MDEVTTLLEHSPQLEDVHHHDSKTWSLALWNNCQHFVSHPYYQDFLRKRLYGDERWDQIFRKIYFVFISILLPITYPFVILGDSIFGNNDLVFISPEMQQSTEENKIKAFYRWAMHKPIFRIYFHHFMESFFLITLGLSSIDPNDAVDSFQLWWYDYLLGIFVIAYVLDNFIDLFQRRHMVMYNCDEYWHIFYFFNHSMLLLGAVMMYISTNILKTDNRQYLSGNHPANIGGTIFAFATLAALIRPLRWLLLHKNFGPVVVCVVKVFHDVFYMMIIIVIIVVAFAIGSFTMLKPFELTKELCHSL